jgi:outer membrane biosynthesis protein TonB
MPTHSPGPAHAVPKHAPAPQDPYDAAHLLENEVELQADRAQPEFARCRDAVPPVHGVIRVAFVVAPDGHVERAQTTQNTTGSTELGACLATAISAWTFATHPARATSFVRPFSYPSP